MLFFGPIDASQPISTLSSCPCSLCLPLLISFVFLVPPHALPLLPLCPAALAAASSPCARGLLLRITHVISVVLLHHASVYSPHAVAHDYTFAIGESVNVACMKAERNRRQTRHPKNVNSQISRSLDVHHALNQRRPYRSSKSPINSTRQAELNAAQNRAALKPSSAEL